VSSRAAQPARRETLTREAARREAVGALRITASIAAYSAEQIGNGLSPQAAQQAALDVAGELEAVAGKLRRLALARLNPAERRALVAELAHEGMSNVRIGAALGVHETTVRRDKAALAGRP
jgi:DNA-directed RNA polymerase specialized sigma24 family protein